MVEEGRSDDDFPAGGRWLYEDGIGERRALLLIDGEPAAIRIERDSDGARVGCVSRGRLVSRRDKLAILESGQEIWLPTLPPHAEGAACFVRVSREAIPERDLVKRARGSLQDVPGDGTTGGPSLLDRLIASKLPLATIASHQSDALEDAGWSELIEQARTGNIPFGTGMLRLSLTPAMAVFDIDGSVPAPALAREAADALARALFRYDIAGSIVADFPTLPGKEDRTDVARQFDRAMRGHFERTSINGYGLLQVIRPRLRPSIAERVQFAPVESAALLLLRRAERARGHGAVEIVAHPRVTAWLAERPQHLAALAQRTGRPAVLRGDATRPIWGGDVQ